MIGRRLVILEPDHHGHRMNYVRILVQYCREQGILPALASAGRTFQSDEFRSRPELRSIKRIDLGEWPERAYAAWFRESVSNLIQSEVGLELLVLEGDKRLIDLLRTWGRAKHRPRLTVLMMRVPKRPRTPREALLFVAKTLLRQLIRLRGGRVVGLSPAHPVARRYRFRGWPSTPDPVSFTGAPIAAPVPDRDGKIRLGIFGHVTARKNVPEVLRRLANNRSRHELEVVVRGRIDPMLRRDMEEATAAARASGLDVVFDDELLSDDELFASVARVDAVIAAYSSSGPSGIVALSVFSGTVLLTVGNEELADATREMGGAVVNLSSGLAALEDDGWIRDVREAEAVPQELADGTEFSRILVDGE